MSTILSLWRVDFELLARKKGYVEWLFPLWENTGTNQFAYKLRKAEAQFFRDHDPTVRTSPPPNPPPHPFGPSLARGCWRE